MFKRHQKILEIDFSGPKSYPDPVIGRKISENNTNLKQILQIYKMQRMLLKNRLSFKKKRLLAGGIQGWLFAKTKISPEEKEVFAYLKASEMTPWWKRGQFDFSSRKSVSTILAVEDAMLLKGFVPLDPESILRIGQDYLEEFIFRTDGLKECLDVLRGGKLEFSYKFRKECLERYGYRYD
jgi:hypothetical protein